MSLEKIKSTYKDHLGIVEIVASLNNSKNEPLALKGLAGSAPAPIFSALHKSINRPLLIVLNDREEAAYFYDDLSLMIPNGKVHFYPSSYKRLAKQGQIEQENIVQRTEALNQISSNPNCVIVSYPDALLEKVISSETLNLNTLKISVREKLSLDFINEVLFEYDFERVDFVYEPGQYSIRGGIIDIFSFSGEEPYRIDFFGDEVESIRSFNIDTQLSTTRYESISIIPNIQQGLEGETRIDLFSYLPKNFILAFREIGFVADEIELSYVGAIKNQDNEDQSISPELLINGQTMIEQLNNFQTIEFGIKNYFSNATEIEFHTSPQPIFNKNFELLAANLKQNSSEGYTNYILSNNEKQIERLQAIFEDKALNVKISPLNFTIHEGFIDHDLKTVFYTDHQIF